MTSALQTIELGTSLKQDLVRRLQSREQILRFEEDPLFASLCTCFALDFEIGNPEFDRLSPFLGVEDLSVWEKTFVTRDNEVGLKLRRRDGVPLQPKHPDLCYLLDRSSIDEKGELSQAILFPRQIAATFREKGFHLVIVRDWILSTALCLDPGHTVRYLSTNEWEIRSHVAGTQAPMMTRNELAFFGTHDIVDHLFGADKSGFESLRAMHNRVLECFARLLQGPALHSRPHLLLAYLIGVALDDLAQPRWYGSVTHLETVDYCLAALEQAVVREADPVLPESFHAVAQWMRSSNAELAPLFSALNQFASDATTNKAEKNQWV